MIAAGPLPTPDVAALVALAELPGIGPATLLRCRRAGDLVGQWEAVRAGRPEAVATIAPALADRPGPRSPSGRPHDRRAELVAAARVQDPIALLERHRADGRRVLVLGGPGYPERLADDPAPPAVLFASGHGHLLAGPTVAIVGTRTATRAGRDLARRWGESLVRCGVSVISGLALGIDGAAHVGALEGLDPSEAGSAGASGPEAGAGPVGVIAAGLDIAYPTRHAWLHREVAGRGLLLSETPLGLRPSAWRFPARNRLIAGLADAVVVVESRSTGGSMLTASEALLRGLPLLAVPGHPTSPGAAGTNDLLAEGAEVARDVEDVLVAIGLGGRRPRTAIGPTGADRPPAGTVAVADLGSAAREVLDVLGTDAWTFPELLARSELGLEAGSEAVAELEAAGLVVRRGAYYERVPGTGGGSDHDGRRRS